MSYVDNIPKEELHNYTIVDDWEDYHLDRNVFIFSNLIINSDVVNNTDLNAFEFYNCFFKECLIIKGPKIQSINIDRCFIDGEIQITEVDAQYHLLIRNTSVKEGLTIHNSKFNLVSINCNCGDMYLTTIESDFLTITHSIVNSFTLKYADVPTVMIDSSTTTQKMSIDSLKSQNYCSLKDVTVIGDIILSDSVLHDFDAQLSSANSLTINDSKIDKSWVTCKKPIKSLEVDDCSGYLEFDRITADNIKIVGYQMSASIVFEWTTVENLTIESFNNLNGLVFASLIPKSNAAEIDINRCYLGKTEFYDVNLSKFKNIRIIDSHLIDCLFSGVQWKYNLNTTDGMKKSEMDFEYYAENREVYRQLKYALSKQGDTINEQKFHTQEMLAHYNSLSWASDFWNKAIIWLSHTTSDFGQSIWWPIRALLSVHYMLFMLALGLRAFEVNSFNDCVYHFFYLINPLHKSEDIFQGWTIILDMLMRIWSSYMIYNIIRASRRFIK